MSANFAELRPRRRRGRNDLLPGAAVSDKETSTQSARKVGLRYVSDARPGLHREPAGKGFRYTDAQGQRVRDKETLARIKSLVIPPAWTDVWICAAHNGHIQEI